MSLEKNQVWHFKAEKMQQSVQYKIVVGTKTLKKWWWCEKNYIKNSLLIFMVSLLSFTLKTTLSKVDIFSLATTTLRTLVMLPLSEHWFCGTDIQNIVICSFYLESYFSRQIKKHGGSIILGREGINLLNMTNSQQLLKNQILKCQQLLFQNIKLKLNPFIAHPSAA